MLKYKIIFTLLVIMMGTCFCKAQTEEYKKHDVAIVFQDYNLIRNLTIGDNMRIAYEAAGLEYDKEDYPNPPFVAWAPEH